MASQVEAGNVDLYAQPVVKNPDGTSSTVDSHSYNIDGKEVLLPSVTPDGRHLTTDAEILAEYKKTGRHLGKFDSIDSANAYAKQLHEDYAAGKYERRKTNMADQDQEPVIIVDANGDEHEFPPGMDPKAAGAAVKRELERVRQEHMAAQHETSDPITAVLNSLKDTASKTYQGIKSGIGSALNPMNTIRIAPKLVQGLTDPAAVMQEGYEAAPQILEQGKKILSGDPEAGGEAIGQLGTMLAAPHVLPKVTPAISGAVEAVQDNPTASAAARGTGRFLVKTAKHASFPVRIAGAHQVLSGNVGPGMAMVFAPELIEGAGNNLIRLGTAPGAALTTPTGQILRMKMDLERAAGGDATALADTKARIAKTQSDLADQLSTARNDTEVNAVKSMQTALSQLSMRANRIEQGFTTAELNKARLDKVRSQTAGLKPGPTKVTVSTPAKNELGETEVARTQYSNKPVQGTADPADELVKSGFARNRAQAKEILKGRAPAKAAPMQPVASHTSSLVQEPGAVSDEVARILGDVGTRGPIRPVASHAPTADDFKAALDELTPSTGRPAQTSTSSMRPSATSREMSATPGLSVNDVKSIGLNPDLKITKLTPEMATKILRDRSLRATDYREMAALKKRLEQLIANPNQ